MKAYFVNPDDDREHMMQFAWEDWWITDYQAYFNQAAATLNIDCIEEVELLCLSLQNRDKICSELHKMEQFFRRKSNAGYVALQRRILSLLTSSAKERYEQMLNNYPSLSSGFPNRISLLTSGSLGKP